MKVKDKEKNFISAVVYINNNEDVLEKFLTKLIDKIDENFYKYEIICVNDCSYDDSYKIIKKVSDKKKVTINVINMSYNQGKELSMNAGVDLSIGDFVYEFDEVNVDYDFETIIDVYKKSLEGYDIVSAKSNKRIRFTSKIFYTFFNKYSNSEFDLTTDTFRIISRRGINRIHSINKTIPYRKALYVNCGLKMTYLTYESTKNIKGSLSKYTKEGRRKTATDALVLFTDLFYKIALYVSILMMVITVGVGAYTIYTFINNNPVAGWTSTMLVISLCFFILFALITVIMKYLQIIVNLLFVNQKYLIASIDKIN